MVLQLKKRLRVLKHGHWGLAFGYFDKTVIKFLKPYFLEKIMSSIGKM